jgi:branched-chain amino acid transport system permease protein
MRPGPVPIARGRPRSSRVAVAAAVALLLAYPWIASPYYATHMVRFFAYAVIVLGLNLLFGYTGLLSFGHSLFVGVGGYTAAVLTSQLGVRSMEAVLLLAALASALVATPVGVFCVRYARIYFAMLTLAFAMLFHSFLLKFYHLTGGDEGMRVVRPALLGVDLAGAPQIAFLGQHYYYYAAAVCLLGLLVMGRIVGSPFGLGLRAIRENPEKAAALGVDVGRYRWAAFVVSAVYAGVGGALLGPITGQVDPGLAYWIHSGNLVFMTLLGGFTHFLGPVVGAFVFIHLQDQVMSLIPYWRLVFGVILAALVIFVPGGLMSLPAIRPGVLAARPSRWRMTP